MGMDRPASLKPDPSDYVAIFASTGIAVVMAVLSFAPSALAEPVMPVSADVTLIVRAIHGTSCDARALGAGSSPKAAAGEEMEKLIVSCSDDPAVGWSALQRGLGGAHACRVVLGDLRQIAPGVRVVRDPTESDPYRCVLSGVTPNQFVSHATWQH
jgi:hypothetical protein